MNLNMKIDNPCIDKTDFCINCNSHFMRIRPAVKSVAVSKRFLRDLKDEEMANSIIKDVLDCSNLEFHELHKFERNINGNLIFRARKGKLHVVYGVDKRMRIIFLTAMRNFTQYKKLLDNKKEIVRMIARATGR
jgi:mRNA-degrading endonuclease RelE of RelBE toxin-antitoxin system